MAAGKNILELQDSSELRMLLRLSWPVILSLVVQGLYGLVDSIYLSRLGEEVLSAVSLSFVVQNLAVAFFSGIATGMNAVISRALGAKDEALAKNTVVCGGAIQLGFVLLFMAFAAFGVPFYFSASTANRQVIAYGEAYLRPCLSMIAATAAQVTLERLLQATGLSRYMLISQAVGSAINIVLDPILIFGLAGFPALGIAGAAYATILGQVAAAGTALYCNLRFNRLLFGGTFPKGRPDWSGIGLVCRIGIPNSAVGVASSLGNYCINRILIEFSSTANAAFGIYVKLQSVALMPTQGLSAGLVTLLAFFYGQRTFPRMQATLKKGELVLFLWNLLCAAAFLLLPEALLLPFRPTEQMLAVGLPAFRIIGSTYLLSGLMTGLNSLFQAIGKSYISLYASLARQILVRIPAALLLSRLHDPNLIWWSWPISEITSDLVCLVCFIAAYRQVKAELSPHASAPLRHTTP